MKRTIQWPAVPPVPSISPVSSGHWLARQQSTVDAHSLFSQLCKCVSENVHVWMCVSENVLVWMCVCVCVCVDVCVDVFVCVCVWICG